MFVYMCPSRSFIHKLVTSFGFVEKPLQQKQIIPNFMPVTKYEVIKM